jgi:hypothetical protein
LYLLAVSPVCPGVSADAFPEKVWRATPSGAAFRGLIRRGPQATLLAFFLALSCIANSQLQAQQVKLHSHAGLDLPTRISFQHGSLQVRQKLGVTVGSRLTIAFNPRLDVVTSVTYTPGYAMLRGVGKRIDIGTGSHLLTATTGARYWVLPAGRTLSCEVHTGFGVVFGGTPAYEDLFETSTLSGVLGTSVRYQIGRIVSLRLAVQQRLYRVRFGGGEIGHSNPLRISFGFGLTFLESLQ